MARVGADLKQKLMESFRSTWNTVYQLAMFHRSDDQALQQEVDKVISIFYLLTDLFYKPSRNTKYDQKIW
jgi:hypothetical protein